MVALQAVRTANKTILSTSTSTAAFVAVFIGATSGIGSYGAQELCFQASNGKNVRLYIVGRKKGAFEEIRSKCLAKTPGADIRFIQAEDLALIKDVDKVSAQIIKSEEIEAGVGKAKIDLLVMTQGFLYFDGRHESTEGLDRLMSILYYSRIRFILQLLPLLLAAPAHVVSVYAPSRDDKIFPDDLSLRDPKHYGFMNMGSHVAYMKTFVFERLATLYPTLSFCHYFPGLVVTEGFGDASLPRWLRLTWGVISPFHRLFSVPRDESGERVLFCATGRFPSREAGKAQEKGVTEELAMASYGTLGGGAYRVDWDGGIQPLKKNYPQLREDGMEEKCWVHTMDAFKEIEAGRVFRG